MRRPELEYTGEFLIPDKLIEIDWQDYQRHILRYIFASKICKDKIVLDIACGTGYGSYILAEAGAKKVIGGEIKSDLLDYANFYYRKDNCSFIRLDCHHIPFSDKNFDIVVSFETIEHLFYREEFLSECRRILKDGGLFICSTPNRLVRVRVPLPIFHLKEFYRREFKSLLQNHFSKVSLFTQDYLSLYNILLRYIKKFFDLLITEVYGFLLKFISKRRLKEIKEYIFKIFKIESNKEFKKNSNFKINKEEIGKYIYTRPEIMKNFDSKYEVRRFKNRLLFTPSVLIALCHK